MAMWRSLILHKNLALVPRHLACLTNRHPSALNTQIISFSRNYSDSSSPASSRPVLPKFEMDSKAQYSSKKPKEDTRLLNLLGIFVSGMITYYGISTYLEYKKKTAEKL